MSHFRLAMTPTAALEADQESREAVALLQERGYTADEVYALLIKMDAEESGYYEHEAETR